MPGGGELQPGNDLLKTHHASEERDDAAEKRRETMKKFKQMFLLRAALLVVSCRVNSNSFCQNAGRRWRRGQGELEAEEGGLLWLINLTGRLKTGRVRFDLILTGTGFVT